MTEITAAQSADGGPMTMLLSPPLPPPIDGDEDAQTIYRLENECYKLRMAMAKVRKATQEWFFLETKLKNATDELDAAKEDRDLMLAGSDSSCPSGAALMSPLCSPIKTETQIKQEQMKRDLQRIEGQLDDHPKFSPEWFKLKEELVELRIKLDEGDTKEKPNNIINNYSKATEEEINIQSKKKQNKENETFNENMSDTEVQVELPPQFHFRPISPPPSPSSLSTSESLSKNRIVQPSPGKPHSNIYYNLDADDSDSIEQKILLKSQHAVACEELNKSLQFSQEWFAAKIKTVQLEEKLEELENKSGSCGGSILSFTNWSENEEEVEAISCADELECAMVAEALKQGCCISPSFVGDENLEGGEGGLDVGQDSVELGLVLPAEDQPEGDNPTTWLEPKLSQSLFNTDDDLHAMELIRVEDEPAKQQVENPTCAAVSPILDDCSSVQGNIDDDQIKIENNHAVIIQKQWNIYCKCKPFKRMKYRALSYQTAKKDASQYERGPCFNLVGFIKNILPKDNYSQWEIFAAILIQNRWRCYTKQKKFRARKSPIRKLKSQKKPPTLKVLGTECLKLSTRLSQLPKFSPEWTLVNVELRLVTEEMEYFYVQSLSTECKAMSN
eukprot:CAMPEP_0201719412 /NCGR_PEP_ID=MMETSP0593-20130828/4621_1 /ASSEMBLY_ACC=CAM_ASM_000672 /TAXON_ID=267983 /ORGANISM="Skeletonema japonicum, Strain CCMP2506" /LENGTH=615 /DNA_ID=CAMNT_0048209847 /DNA_START=105 /DNA_END=1952 /DNA_ORIENTATION=-